MLLARTLALVLIPVSQQTDAWPRAAILAGTPRHRSPQTVQTWDSDQLQAQLAHAYDSA